jgi:DNA invertase Pin-like site-specific DNA recombinase
MTAIYARQSADKKDSISIESQIEFCQREALGEEIRVYSDKGYSGKNTNRPDFERLISDIKRGRIGKVVCYRLDRISRSVADFANTYELFEKHGVKFVSCNEQYDTSTPMGKAMFGFGIVIAQLERETIIERVKDNYYKRGEKGLYLGGQAPYGFTKIAAKLDGIKTSTFEPKDFESAIIKKVYDMFVNVNFSLSEIVEKLNERQNKNFYETKIFNILRNTFYVRADAEVYKYLTEKGVKINVGSDKFDGKKGVTIYGDPKIRKEKHRSKFNDLSGEYAQIALHEGIIDAETWLKAQRKIDAKQSKTPRRAGTGTSTWLTGLLKCGYCGKSVYPIHKKTVICGGRKEKYCYDSKKISYICNIERESETKLLDFIANFPFLKLARRNKIDRKTEKIKIKIAELNERQRDIKEQIKLLKNFSAFSIIAVIDDELKNILSEKKVLQLEIDKIYERFDDNDIPPETLENYVKNWFDYDQKTKKIVANIFIIKIILTDEKTDIFYKF